MDNSEKKPSRAQLLAKVSMTPTAQAGITLKMMAAKSGWDGLNALDLAGLLSDFADKAAAGDLSEIERTLAVQAKTLDHVFHSMAQRAVSAAPDGCEAYLRLAFRAQDSCRKTALALAEIKNPRRTAFIKQMNVAHVAGPANSEKNLTQANELLTVRHGETLDTGREGQAGGANPPLEAVGAVNRPED